jgi:hypothetical protein
MLWGVCGAEGDFEETAYVDTNVDAAHLEARATRTRFTAIYRFKSEMIPV